MLGLLKAFIALCMLIPIADCLTLFLESIMKKFPFLPDQFEWPIAYTVVSGLAFTLCSQGHWSFFSVFGFNFPAWEGNLITALLIGAGSKYSTKAFGELNGITPFLAVLIATAMGIANGMILKTTAQKSASKEDDNQ